jgi:hypothetical protein
MGGGPSTIYGNFSFALRCVADAIETTAGMALLTVEMNRRTAPSVS